ncbi:hypothetical protein D9756_005041 [Leucocoprinus leucothites]|uniref:Uncharacterized protein n=1 Tax=Leucocoprinus leucothites TaxID=201217 RepID=A0A8H5G9C6_9AGAR|nr:hypothetical protein D9756_005041 [Leucoagaricus leucothites]
MSSHHFPHPYQNPEYAPPVLRAPSPASSVGTTYGPDQTSFSDSEQQLSQPAFEKKWLAKLELDKPRKEEEEANESPLIPRAESKEEEHAMVERIIKNLRVKIRQLEEDELFEQTLLRGSQVGLEARPTTNDIDSLMKSMMGTGMSLAEGPSGKIFGRAADETLTNGPWNSDRNRSPMAYEGNSGVGMESILSGMTTSSTFGKRSRSGKSRRVK